MLFFWKWLNSPANRGTFGMRTCVAMVFDTLRPCCALLYGYRSNIKVMYEEVLLLTAVPRVDTVCVLC